MCLVSEMRYLVSYNIFCSVPNDMNYITYKYSDAELQKNK